MHKKFLVLMISTLFSINALADDSYMCITDHHSGYHHNETHDSWEQANFLAGERYAINELRQNIYEVRKLEGEQTWSALCTVRTDLTDDSFSCTSGTSTLHFNRKLLRFILFRFYGYWNGSTDSISISIGQCYAD